MEMSVTRRFTFEAAHYLPRHPGRCHELHGHRYELEVTVTGPVSEDGMVIDFSSLAETVQRQVIDHYDHTVLNHLLDNPTAELVLSDIWNRLEQAGLVLAKLKLNETESNYAELTR